MIRVFGILIAFYAFFFNSFLKNVAQAQLEIEISSGSVAPRLFIISKFSDDSDNPESRAFLKEIEKVISSDLRNSGLFENPRTRFVQDLQDVAIPFDKEISFEKFRKTGAEFLINGALLLEKGRKRRIAFRLWDLISEKHMTAYAYEFKRDDARRIAHKIADEIYARITGETGYFDSRIAYISESGPATKRVKKLAIMDYDGANHSYITLNEDLVLTPRFSPARNELLYMRLYEHRARVYWMDLNSGKQIALGEFKGMQYAPNFAADGNSIVFSHAKNGNSDIWTMNLIDRSRRKLTRHTAIDTSPSFSPDGKRIAFNSNRSGSPQIYVMNANGKNVRRVSFGKGRFTTPSWSPRGDLIAFTRYLKGRFSIGVMSSDGKGARILLQDFHAEGPTWSPNGRHLAFFRQKAFGKNGSGGRASIYSIDITGRNFREILTPEGGSDPTWSGLNP